MLTAEQRRQREALKKLARSYVGVKARRIFVTQDSGTSQANGVHAACAGTLRGSRGYEGEGRHRLLDRASIVLEGQAR